MAEPSQDTIITIPSTIDATNRERLGVEVVRFIIARTKKGLDINNNRFKGYSASYKDSLDFDNAGKSSLVNLTLTGEMLNTLELKSHGVGYIKIGFDDSESNNKASYNRQNGRQFVGINAKDLNMLIKNFTETTEVEKVRSDISSSFAASFIKGLLGGE